MSTVLTKDMTTGSGICDTPFVRFSVPAVLQCGGYDYRGAVSGAGGACGRRLYGLCQFYDHRILHGSVQRICDTGGT